MEKTENQPFFSVIICTYNRAKIIKRALDSLIAQKSTHWEAIIIDDGSMDNTKEVIRPYLKKRPIQYFKKEHSGLAHSRNAGMQIAKGKYITFLDTDDKYAPEHLQHRQAFLEKHPEIDLLHSNVKIVGDPYLPDKNNPQQLIHIDKCAVGGSFFIKKQSLDPSNLFQNQYSDDSFFMENMIAQGKKVVKIDAPTYIYYRDQEDSLSHQKKA